MANEIRCLDDNRGHCEGEVLLRGSLTGTGTPIPRCDHHWALRLDYQDEHERRFPVMAPADFDPAYAGESWEEE